MIIVAGITRSGLTLTMQMLHAGGFPCFGGPPGFEKYRIGAVPWQKCADKAVKLIDAHLHLPPDNFEYKIISPRRDLDEQAKSFNKFSSVFGFPTFRRAKLKKSFSKDYRKIDKWAKRHETLFTRFEDMIERPLSVAETIRDFIGADLDIKKMASVVIKRSPKCHPEMLEIKLIEKDRRKTA